MAKQKPHFYAVSSRLGMINLPNHGTELNLGVEDGPRAVLERGFLAANFPGAEVTEFSFPLPEDLDKKDYYQVLASQSDLLADKINQSLEKDETQVIVGGDHSVAFAGLLAVLRRHQAADVGYVQFDSHGDVHLFGTSPSGNFHGMWLRPFLSKFDEASLAKLVPATLGPGQVMFVGNLELESEEERIFAEHRVAVINSDALAEDRAAASQRLKTFLDKFAHIHLSFDIDVFDKKLVSATGTPAENGMSKPDVFGLLEGFAKLPSVSVDLVEVNPRKTASRGTIALAQETLAKLLV